MHKRSCVQVYLPVLLFFFRYTPITRQAYYQVIVEMLGFWNQTIPVPTNNITTIVDSGTGLVLMPYDVYQVLQHSQCPLPTIPIVYHWLVISEHNTYVFRMQPFTTALQKAICSSSAAMPAFCDPTRNVFTSVIGFAITDQVCLVLYPVLSRSLPAVR
jgi:hypothetical protein